jgi:hypothetical protein
MPLDWRTVEMPLGGVDQFTDAPHVVPGKMRELENVRFRTPPAMSKRYGSTPLTTDAVDIVNVAHTFGVASRLVAHNDVTLQCTDDQLFMYSPIHNKWLSRGYLSPCHIDRQMIQADMKAADNWDSAYNQGILVYAAHVGAGIINILVVDATSGAILYNTSNSATVFKSGAEARVVAVGDYIYVIWANAYARMDVTSGDYTFTYNLFSGVPTLSRDLTVDACAMNSGYLCLAGVNDTTGFGQVYIIAALNGAVTASLTLPQRPTQTIAVSATEGYGAMAIYDDGAGALKVTRSTEYLLGAVESGLGSATIESKATIVRSAPGVYRAMWQTPATATTHGGLQHANIVHSSGAFTLYTIPSVFPASKLSRRGDRVIGWVVYPSLGKPSGTIHEGPAGGDDETLYLVELELGAAKNYRWLGTAARGIAARSVGTRSFLPSFYPTIDGQYESAASLKAKFAFAGKDDITIHVDRTSTARLRVSFNPPNKHEYAQWGGGLMFAGAAPSWYDSALVESLGFAWRPGTIFFQVGGPTSGLPPGFYQIAATYERYDTLGYLHRSAPSEQIELELTHSPGSVVSVECREKVLRQVWDDVPQGVLTDLPVPQIRGFRSIIDGPVLYEVPAVKDAVEGVSVSATAPDTDINKRALLYTTGGILDNAGPPPCKLITNYQNRLWLGGLEEPESVWFSQPFVSGEGPRFNETLSLRMKFPVKALASLDSQLVVFGEDAIQVVAGSGPPATGGLDIGFRIFDVASDVGCIDPRSVVVYRDGVLFQSRKGLYRLGRDNSVTHVGAPAKGYLNTYPVVSSACVMPERSEVIWTVQGPDLMARLVWNYEVDAWSLDTLPLTTLPISSAVTHNTATGKPAYSMLSYYGVVYREDQTVFWDGPNQAVQNVYSVRVVTPWVHRNTLQDWLLMRGCSLLLKRRGTHGISVRVAYDHEEDSWSLPYSWTPSQIAQMGDEQLYIDFERQDCRAVRLEITETFDVAFGFAGASLGPELYSIVFEGGFMAPGRSRVPAAQRR